MLSVAVSQGIQVVINKSYIAQCNNAYSSKEMNVNLYHHCVADAAFCQNLFGQDTTWKQTSYNDNFRVRYAGEGYTYDSTLDAFIPIKPYDSWILNTDNYQWKAPVDYPTDGDHYTWNEITQQWSSRITAYTEE